MKTPLIATLAIVLATTSLACVTDRQKPPELASPVEQVDYASDAPERLDSLNGRLDAGMTKTKETMTAMESYPDALKTSDWAAAKEILLLAAKAGRQRPVVEDLARQRLIEGFLEEHGKAISRRIDAGVSASLKKNKCECSAEVGGSIRYALGEGASKELEDGYRSRHPAHRALNEKARAMGKRDTATLRDQIDALTLAGHFVFVEAPAIRLSAQRYLDESGDIKDTLESALEAEKATLSDSDSNKTKKRAAQKQIEALEAELKTLEGATTRAEADAKGWDETIAGLEKSWKEAIGKMEDALDAKQ